MVKLVINSKHKILSFASAISTLYMLVPNYWVSLFSYVITLNLYLDRLNMSSHYYKSVCVIVIMNLSVPAELVLVKYSASRSRLTRGTLHMLA